MKVINSEVAIKRHGQGHGFTCIVKKSFLIFSCYSFGNEEIADLVKSLDQIGQLIRTNGTEAIITGDYIAKSPQWRMGFSDARGNLITEWISAYNYIVNNQGAKLTFSTKVTGQYWT